ncbi:hypothetical protein PAECIP111890_01121 [Paenibacillus sp. JJ-223]|nr:hypothetical protein PAECIP111890_01121 [Paenibacillus sp. JJ-223]
MVKPVRRLDRRSMQSPQDEQRRLFCMELNKHHRQA